MFCIINCKTTFFFTSISFIIDLKFHASCNFQKTTDYKSFLEDFSKYFGGFFYKNIYISI